jgi:DNA-binding MarR family transcriptional regulator
MEQNERNDNIGNLAMAMLRTAPLLYRRMIKKYEMLDGTNLAYPKLVILMTLKREGPIPLSVIAELHSYSRQNLTTLTDHLEADGLVRRSPDVNDRRVTNLELTDAGIRYIRESGMRIKQGLIKELECLDDTDIEALHNSFETIERIYLKISGARN